MKNDRQNEENRNAFRRLRSSLLFLLIALVGIAGAAVAWFSISTQGRLESMVMNITSGVSLRFDLDGHKDIGDYVESLNFSSIAARVKQDYGYDMETEPLAPVTTEDAVTFTYEDGYTVEETTGEYVTFTLHFMGQKDMIVHLTGDDDDGKAGTLVSSENENLANSMRISFTADGVTYIYDPGAGDTSSEEGKIKTFGLPSGDMVYNGNNALFSLEADEDKEVLVHIWIEGTDEACSDSLKGADYSISLKFQGTDENFVPIDLVNEEEDVATGRKADDYVHDEDDEDDGDDSNPAEESDEDSGEEGDTWIEGVFGTIGELIDKYTGNVRDAELGDG